MYSRKSVTLRIDQDGLGTPPLNGHSCEDFPSRATQSSLLLSKDQIRPNI